LKTLLAVLGRGIQRLTPNGEWTITEDLEVTDNGFAHKPVRVPVDDCDPCCIVGGGEINLKAAEIMYLTRKDIAVAVFAYGARSDYLISVDAPTESMVMSHLFFGLLRPFSMPEIVVWPKDRPSPGGSAPNTRQEVLNAMELAVTRDIPKVIFLSVTAHLPRTTLFVDGHLKQDARLKDLDIEYLASESVLMQDDPVAHAGRVMGLFSSQAFTRTVQLERRGMNAFLSGSYGKPST